MTRTRETNAGSALRDAQPPPSRRQVGKRAVHWRKDADILRRLEEVERLHSAGLSNRAIARRLGIDEWTVRRDLERLQELWEERVGQRVVELRAQCVAQLDSIYRQAMQNAERDRQYERWVLFGIVPDGMGPASLAPADGRATFRGDKANSLNVARQAVMDMAKLLGLARAPQPDQDRQRMTLAQLMQAARDYQSQARETDSQDGEG